MAVAKRIKIIATATRSTARTRTPKMIARIPRTIRTLRGTWARAWRGWTIGDASDVPGVGVPMLIREELEGAVT